MRWPTCRATDFRVNPSDEPAGMTGVVKRTFALVGRQTGATFHYAGTTKYAFSSSSHSWTTPTIHISFTCDYRGFSRL